MGAATAAEVLAHVHLERAHSAAALGHIIDSITAIIVVCYKSPLLSRPSSVPIPQIELIPPSGRYPQEEAPAAANPAIIHLRSTALHLSTTHPQTYTAHHEWQWRPRTRACA